VSVDYSRQYCEEFVKKLLECPPTTVVLVWAHLAFGTHLVLASEQPWQLVEDWKFMGLWNKQAILYMLAPHIERIACERAHAVEQEARELEPL